MKSALRTKEANVPLTLNMFNTCTNSRMMRPNPTAKVRVNAALDVDIPVLGPYTNQHPKIAANSPPIASMRIPIHRAKSLNTRDARL